MRTASIIKIAGLVMGSLILISASVLGQAAKSTGKAEAKTAAPKNPTKATPQSIDAGKTVFQARCASCHGASAKGDSPVAASMPIKPSNLTDDKWEHGSTDGEIFTNIRDGIGPKFAMKPFKDKIQDSDIWNVVNYIRSLGPKK